MSIFRIIASKNKNLNQLLKQAGMSEAPEQFVKKTFISSIYMTAVVAMFVVGVFSKLKVGWGAIIAIILVIGIILFSYLMKVPEGRIMKKKRDINKEIVFAGRFLIVEAESGISLYNAMVNISRSFEGVGEAFEEIVHKVDLGTNMEDALNEAIQTTPNPNLARILWQILNVLQTGADISSSLKAVVEEIIKEQMIEIQEYGKKLNPLAMFYMIVTVIMPSLGVTAIIVASSFLSIKLELIFLLSLVGLLGFVQFMFVAMIKSARPGVEL